MALRLVLRSEGRRIRLISEQPRLTMLLRRIDLGVMPRDTREWLLGWLEDVETAARSRETMVGFVTFLIYSTAFSAVAGGIGVFAPRVAKVLER